MEKTLIELAREYKLNQDKREKALTDIKNSVQQLGEYPTLNELVNFLKSIREMLKDIAEKEGDKA